MVAHDKLIKMYHLLMYDCPLTTASLNECGFQKSDFDYLIETKVLAPTETGDYTFLATEDIYQYGKSLLNEKNIRSAILCFQAVARLNPNHLGAAYQLFFDNLKHLNYEEAFKYFDILAESSDPQIATESNFYLFLLGMITTLPEKYHVDAQYLKYDDFKLVGNEEYYDKTKYYEMIELQNRIRTSAWNHKFSHAYHQHNKLIAQYGQLTIQNRVVQILLKQAMGKQSKFKAEIRNLIKSREYAQAIWRYEQAKETRRLGVCESHILFLLKDIVNLEQTGQIPAAIFCNSPQLYQLIKTRNYREANHINSLYIRDGRYNSNDGILDTLLKEIVNLINRVNDQKTQEKHEEKVTEVPEIHQISNQGLNYLNQYLKTGKTQTVLTIINNQLKAMANPEMKFLIVNLIKIVLLDEESSELSWNRVLNTYQAINDGSFKYKLAEYLKWFYDALIQSKLKTAQIYLAIISEATKIGYPCELLTGLEMVLTKAYQVANQTKPDLNLTDLIFEYQARNQEPSKPPTEVKAKPSVPSFKPSSPLTKVDFNDLVHTCLSTVYNRDLILLNPMEPDLEEKLKARLEATFNVRFLTIEIQGQRQLVVFYHPYSESPGYTRVVWNNARKAYHQAKYNRSLEYSRQQLRMVEKPNSAIFALIGLSLFQLEETKEALDYLTIATALNYDDHQSEDFTDLINQLKTESNSKISPVNFSLKRVRNLKNKLK